MSTDDPFDSTNSESTFIVPSPGRRAQARAATSQAPVEPPADVESLIPDQGLNTLVAAASPLLNAGPPLRASLTNPDPAVLHETLVRGIRAFEARATRVGVTPQHVLAGRYVLCTFVDEMAASTPWGGSGVWGKYSLLVQFHNEAWGGEKVFQLLAKLAENPKANRELLELIYVVLALGFEGRYRVMQNGRSQLDKLRERLLVMITAERGPHERELAVHWKGVVVKRPTFLLLPMWVVFTFVGLLAVALLCGLRASLDGYSRPVFNQIARLQANVTGSQPPPPPREAPPRLKVLLANQRTLNVADFEDRSVVTMQGEGLFASGGTTVADAAIPVIDAIGRALVQVPGKVDVVGYTDDRPISSRMFKSNAALSEQRAASVKELLQKTVDGQRMKAIGRGEADPVGNNATNEGRAQNRRVEITLYPSNGS